MATPPPDYPPGLSKHRALIESFARPGAGFSLAPDMKMIPGASRLGGRADLPAGFRWPTHKDRKLDFLIQVSLRDLVAIPSVSGLPSEGLLSVFYDLDAQPWGFDPKELEGHRVVFTAPGTPLEQVPAPHRKTALEPFLLRFQECLTLPEFGSRDYDRLSGKAAFADEEADAYFEMVSRWGPETPAHRLLGHSANIQGDMQLEAQLVTHGIYCGGSEEDPRAAALETGSDDWMLLLQVDSDDGADLQWGDCGMLYVWIRRPDLAARRFDRTWMGLQCY